MSDEYDLTEVQDEITYLDNTSLASSAEVVQSGESAPEFGASAEAAATVTAMAPDADQAFEWLRQALSELIMRRAMTTAAGVKSELMRVAAGEFHESDLGFTSFRAFLESAAEAGVVTLTLPVPGSGQDVVVTLSGQAPPPGRPSPNRQVRSRIRPDLWTAFVDWNQSFVRLWDRVAGRAVILSKSVQDGEPLSITRVRQRFAQQPQDFVLIKPIGQEEQLEWMRSFAESVADRAPDLQASLEDQRPAASFARALRADPAVAATWRSRMSELVISTIRAWEAKNGLQIDLAEEPFVPDASLDSQRLRSSGMSLASQAPSGGRGYSSAEADLRTQLLSVLSGLSTDELLQIKVPIVYALRP